MPNFTIHKVTALPGTLVANAVYVEDNGAPYATIHIVDNAGAVARRTINEADVNSLISAAVASSGAIEITDTITTRDALVLTANSLVLVLDATGDGTVDSGAATYAYRLSDDTFHKISEAESQDIALQWANITGGPSSTPAQIDAAAAATHTHANKTQLDQIGQDADGNITYNGNGYVVSGVTQW